MSTNTLDIERWVLELLIVLKQESEILARIETWLGQVRHKVVERDESGLEALLKDIQATQGQRGMLEQRRQQIRQALATVLGLPFQQVTLTRLTGLLEGELKTQVSRMKSRLHTQTETLRAEHRGTAMLLVDCARFNRMLLNSIFEESHQTVTTYTPRGNAQHKRSSGFVNMQL
jgi:ribosomal protein L34